MIYYRLPALAFLYHISFKPTDIWSLSSSSKQYVPWTASQYSKITTQEGALEPGRVQGIL